MELRAEPRFGTRSSAVLEVIRDKVYTYDATITEVSGIGLRIEMAEELTEGEDIRLLVNDYLLFARVRRCIPFESGFTIGLERIDDWNGPRTENALVPLNNTTTILAKMLGRPKLKNPLDNLHLAAFRALFADPRLRTRKTKYQAVAITAGCIALAGWAAIGVGFSLHGKAQNTPAKAGSAKPLPDVPKSAAIIAPPKAAATNLIAVEASNPAVVVPPLPKAPVEQPPVRKAEGVAPPKLAARPTTVRASKISIKASEVSWVTACVDGAKALNTLLAKGYAGEVPFSRQATFRFGNAGAIELAVGNQPATKLGPSGQVRTVKVTPTGYELITVPASLNCNLD
jgi:hypothetical protein